METIRPNTGIKEIAVENEKGEVTAVLKIDVNDLRTAEKFANLITNLNNLSDKAREKQDELDRKYKDRPITGNEGKEPDIEQILERSSVNVSLMEECIEEIDGVFGAGTIRKVFSESYELNPDFIPDEQLLTEFIDSIIPVMNRLYKTRFEENKKRYSAGKRGKNTR